MPVRLCQCFGLTLHLKVVKIDPGVVTDTLELSLGYDAGIIIERERLTDFTSRSFFGGKKTETIAWENNVRNNKRHDIKLVLFDQIPVSTDKDIDVELLESSGASLDKNTGILTWRLELKASESDTKIMKYSVTYPRDKDIVLE